MRSGNETIGMPVVTYDTGEEIGRVKDLIVHRAKKCVVGLLVKTTALFHHTKVVSLSDVMSFEDSGVMIRAANSLVSLSEMPESARLLERKRLNESTLISRDGHEIGRIFDFQFEEKSGELKGFDVAVEFDGESEDDSPIETEFLPFSDEIFLGRDDVIASNQAIALLMNGSDEDHSWNADTSEMPVVDLPPPKLAIPAAPPPMKIAAQVEQRKSVVPDELNVTAQGSTLTIGFKSKEIPDDLSIAGYRDQILKSLAEREGCTKLVFDVANFKLLPSTMLGMLVGLRKKVDKIEIHNASRDVHEVLKMMGFDKYMTIRDQGL